MHITLRLKVILLFGACLLGLASALIMVSISQMRTLASQAQERTAQELRASINARLGDSVRFQASGIQRFFEQTQDAAERGAEEVERTLELAAGCRSGWRAGEATADPSDPCGGRSRSRAAQRLPGVSR